VNREMQARKDSWEKRSRDSTVKFG